MVLWPFFGISSKNQGALSWYSGTLARQARNGIMGLFLGFPVVFKALFPEF